MDETIKAVMPQLLGDRLGYDTALKKEAKRDPVEWEEFLDLTEKMVNKEPGHSICTTLVLTNHFPHTQVLSTAHTDP